MRDELLNALLDTLIETGAYVDFYGAVSTTNENGDGEFRIGVHDRLITFLVKCDPCDGYRSSMDGVYHPPADDDTIFFATPIASVRLVKGRAPEPPDTYHTGSENDLYHIADRDGHVWLSWGTDDTDDYYPSFVFDYSPKAGVQ